MPKPRGTARSNFTLLPDETEEPLVKLLEDERMPYRLRDIDVSHCILANTDQLLHCISKCFRLRSLCCVGCSFTATDVLRMLLHQVRRLEGLRFSLVAEHDIARDMTNMLKEHSEGRSVSSLETMYAEVRGSSNLALLEAFVSCCSNLTDLHVHFVGGELPYALSFCEQVTEAFVKLRRLTFTSEVPACLRLEIPTPLDLSACLRICANTTYIKWPDTKYSCVRLEDIARSCGSPEMRRQLVVVAVYPPEILGEIIKNTRTAIRWRYLCELCLVLVPPKPKRIHYPTIGADFQPSLRQFFTYNLKSLVELNVNSFHFSADLDLTELIKYAKLEHLKALSAPPCGIRHPGALQRVAETCKLFEELDVRLYRRSHLVRCAVCEMPRALRAEDVAPRNAYTATMFTRLTLSDLPSPACFDLPVHSNVTNLRLVNLPEDAHPLLAFLSDIFYRTRNLRRLLLQQELVPFADDSFMEVLSRLPMLRCLCLLTSFAATDDKAALLFDKLSVVLKDLEVAHLHYRREPDGAEQRVTWFRSVGGQGSRSGRGVLLRDRACIMCSTATFIGLAKPKTGFPIFFM